MIQLVPSQNIDPKKYNHCVETSNHPTLFANFELLNILTNHQWECLIWNDYEAVMPIPLNKKFFISLVIQPLFCQQLGVFSSKPIPMEVFQEMQNILHQKRVINYHWNENNNETYHPKGIKKSNYILPLNLPYEQLWKNYNQNTKRNIKTLATIQYEIKESKQADWNFVWENKNFHFSKQKQSILSQLIHFLQHNNQVKIMEIWINQELIGQSVFIITAQQLTYLFSIRKKTKLNHAITTILIDDMIKNYANTPIYLDFEGSNIPSIAQFFRGFGAIEKKYISYTRFKF